MIVNKPVYKKSVNSGEIILCLYVDGLLYNRESACKIIAKSCDFHLLCSIESSYKIGGLLTSLAVMGMEVRLCDM